MMKFFELVPEMKAAAAEKIVLNDPDSTSIPDPCELMIVENVEPAPREYEFMPLSTTPKPLPVPPLVISIFCPVPKKL
jgi:hypothetical protein